MSTSELLLGVYIHAFQELFLLNIFYNMSTWKSPFDVQHLLFFLFFALVTLDSFVPWADLLFAFLALSVLLVLYALDFFWTSFPLRDVVGPLVTMLLGCEHDRLAALLVWSGDGFLDALLVLTVASVVSVADSDPGVSI